ncbi:MAG: hypothetical protein D6770_09570, partial [Anaerolineae bacterium]
MFYHERPHPRDVLLGLFWPEYSENRARRALSQALWNIRSEYSDLLKITADTIQVSPRQNLWVDVEEFRRLACPYIDTEVLPEAYEDLHQASLLYRGDFLEDIYDDWALLERERLRELYLQTLEMLIRLEKKAGRYQQALDLSLVLLDKDPLREAAHREAMRLYHLLGRPEAALQQFEKCRHILKEELALEPNPETVALIREIATRSGKALPPHLPLMPHRAEPVDLRIKHPIPIALVGRSKERADLLMHVDAVFSGQGGMVLMDGEAGVGKTRLLQEVARDAEWRGAQVLWGAGDELGATAPYAPLCNALTSGLSSLRISQLRQTVDTLWLRVLKPLLPPLAVHLPNLEPLPSLEPAQERARLVEAVQHLLAGWAKAVPLIVILEDVHWMDADTLDLLLALAPRLKACGVLFICTSRRGEVRDQPATWQRLRHLDRTGALSRYEIDRLDAEATGELIRRALGLTKPAPLFEKRIYRETAGNPLFVLETLRALQDEQLLVQDEKGDWHTPWDETTSDYAELPLTPLLEQVISRRLQRLAPDLRDLLNLIAVLGQQVSPDLLQAAAALPAEQLFSEVRELVLRHFLRETPEGYTFVHAKIRQVVYGELAPEERIRYHLRAAEALEAKAPHRVEALAHHYTLGQAWKKAVYYHYQAGRGARQSFSYPLARKHFSEALALLEHAEDAPVERFDLLAAREEVLDILGEREAQSADLDAMQEMARDDSSKLCRVALRRARLLAHLSRYRESLAVSRHALDLSRELGDTLLQAEALNAIVTVLARQGKDQECIPLLQEAIGLSRQAGDAIAESRYRRALANSLLGLREYEAARKELEAALRQATQRNDLLELAEIYNLLGIISMERGDSEQARLAYEESIKHSRAIGFRFGEARALSNLGNLYYFLGHLGQMLEYYEKSAVIFQALNDKRGELRVLLNWASVSLNVLGDSQRVLDIGRRAWDYARQTDDALIGGTALVLMGDAELQSGDYHRARDHLTQGIRLLESTGDRW